MRPSTGRLLEEILGSLFPRVCPVCRVKLREPARGFCAACAAAVLPIRPPVCARCGVPSLPGLTGPAPAFCPDCVLLPGGVRAPEHTLIRSAAWHADPLRRAVLSWKYAGRLALSPSLAWLVRQAYGAFYAHDRFDCIVPVPLHVRRLRQRGFNQCVLLAVPLAKRLGLPVEVESVTKVRHTPPQSGGGSSRRRTNLQGAFRVVEPARFAGRSVLILDDVVTTGTTVETLARALRAAGAARVCAITLTRSLEHGSPALRPRTHPAVGRESERRCLDRTHPHH